MVSKPQLLTQKSKEALINTMGVVIDTLAIAVDGYFKKKQQMEKAQDLLEFNVHLSFVRMDLAAALRLYLSAKKPHEERFVVKHLNVIMIEGYKRIYGYNKNIKESFWITKIKPICDNLPQEYQNDYNELTDKIIEIGSSGVFDRDSREYSIHYDLDVKKVYDMLCSLNGEVAATNTILFLRLLEDIDVFIIKILEYMKSEE